jgi:hypothetical protein
MQPIVRLALGTVVIAAVVGTPTAAFAQMGQRAFRGLFSGAGHDPSVRHSLEFGAHVTEAYDDDAPGEFVGSPTDFLVSGFSTVLGFDGTYKWRNNRFEFGANGTSVLRYYNPSDNFRSSTHVGGVGFSAKLSRSSELFANQTVAYSPSHLYTLFPVDPSIEPGEAPPSGEDFRVVDTVSTTYNSDVRWTQRLGLRNGLLISGNFNYTDFQDDQPVPGQPIYDDLRSSLFRADFTRNFNSRLALVSGYFYRQGDYANSTGEETTEHGVEGGLDYNRRLSATRSAFIGFRLAASRIKGQVITPTGLAPAEQSLFSGSVNGGYQFGRSWAASANYRRGVDFVPGFLQPVVSDGLSVGVSGAVTTRWELFTSFGYTKGDSALIEQTFPFRTYTGQVTNRFGLTKLIAATLEYIYYYYRFDDGTPLPVGVPQGLERNGIRAGLTVWVPAFRR